jgi:hypothetical protein
MRKTRTIGILFVFLAVTAAASAQVEIPGSGEGKHLQRSVFGIGLFGGPASGLGLSFRHHLPSAFSYQVTGGVIKVDEKLYYDIGGEIQYDFILGSTSRVFAVAGGGYYHAGESGDNEMDGPARVGLGIGGEFRLVEGIHGIAEAVFTYFTDGTILPLPQVGLYYYFL